MSNTRGLAIILAATTLAYSIAHISIMQLNLPWQEPKERDFGAEETERGSQRAQQRDDRVPKTMVLV